MRSPVLLFILAVPLCAQPVSIGAKIGVPFIDPMGGHSESRPYAVGPTVEVRLPAGFAIEASAIYRRLGQSAAFAYTTGANSVTYTFTRTRGNSWEFPLIGKYYFGRRTSKYRPFLGSGWALRTVGWHVDGTVSSSDYLLGSQAAIYRGHYRSDLNVGATAAAGVQFRAGRITMLPEIRYTRWGRDYNIQRMNEAGFFLGLRF